MKKFKKTVFIGIFVSLAAQIRLQVITEGFIIALSVLVMAIFIYCYEDLSPKYIAICSGIFSPLFRLIILAINDGSFEYAALLAVPDAVFFFSYGIIYTFIYNHVILEPKSIRNFPYALIICDFGSNIMELISRSLLADHNVITVDVVVYLLLIAIGRTVLIQMILIAMETYSNLLVKKEHDEEYRRLITQASIFESEIHVLEKNATEIEDIMKQAFSLYRNMEKIDAPRELQQSSLEISRNAHEIKGDYLNIVGVLKDTFVDGCEESKISINDIVIIEKANLQSIIKKQSLNIELVSRVWTDFYVSEYFKMMSILRNLLLNSVEAIGSRGGKINLTVKEEGANYLISVRDNGQGIGKENLETIFLDGFSTKFNMETGNIQRGLGLNLVKDYVENYFDGTIVVNSQVGKYAEFLITIPRTVFEEVENEILYS